MKILAILSLSLLFCSCCSIRGGDIKDTNKEESASKSYKLDVDNSTGEADIKIPTDKGEVVIPPGSKAKYEQIIEEEVKTVETEINQPDNANSPATLERGDGGEVKASSGKSDTEKSAMDGLWFLPWFGAFLILAGAIWFAVIKWKIPSAKKLPWFGAIGVVCGLIFIILPSFIEAFIIPIGIFVFLCVIGALLYFLWRVGVLEKVKKALVGGVQKLKEESPNQKQHINDVMKKEQDKQIEKEIKQAKGK